ncbi:hypothetical protein [Hydrogenophaga sp.]|uniref:hypothetical protein n=1 Tax=Hydrogenophaga sp. TaxID=1904254 RepID=UPI003F72616A
MPADTVKPAGRTRLAIGERETRIVAVPAQGPATERVLPIGTQALGSGPFRHEPPSPLEIEHAIEQVEEAVMPLLRQLPRDTPWETRDAATLQLRRLVHGGGEGRLSIDDVERVFNQLAAVSQGRPVASSGLPPQAAFTAHVLILREAMHHLGFASLTVLSDSA